MIWSDGWHMIPVRVANAPKSMLNNISTQRRVYYKKQAAKVTRILNHQIIQSLLAELIESENIDSNKISDIRVMVLPSIRDREYGEHLYGLYDPKLGQISIYPAVRYKGSKFLNDPLVSFQFIRESFDTLIHEVLHARYSKESTVRRLTQKYLKTFHTMLSKNLE